MKTSRWHSCNVVQVGADARLLWQFAAGNGHVALNAQQRLEPTSLLPARAVARDWTTLWHKKLNIAWLPAGQVFLRIARFPKCDPTELLPMVELQLEKISPLPVNQIVWTVEVLPNPPGDLQAVAVIVIERRVVEEFLGKLEGAGYLADRVELPILHQLVATRIDEDGVWVYLVTEEKAIVCLLAWRSEGAWQALSLLNLPPGEAGISVLRNELDRIAWAGEFEGWLTSKPQLHLVSDNKTNELYRSPLQDWAGTGIEVHSAAGAPALAELSAQRSISSQSTANLLPAEYAVRYHQQFIDRLWMRGLGALILLYLAGVLVYLAVLQVRKYQKGKLENEVAALSGSYTNALQLKTKARILQEQVNLQFAALDCLKVVSEQLPPELTLRTFQFEGGKKLSLHGEVPADSRSKVTEFNVQLGSTMLHGTPLFAKVSPPTINPVSGSVATWDFNCELRTPGSR